MTLKKRYLKEKDHFPGYLLAMRQENIYYLFDDDAVTFAMVCNVALSKTGKTKSAQFTADKLDHYTRRLRDENVPIVLLESDSSSLIIGKRK